MLLPLVGLGTRVSWRGLPELLASEPARLALGLSLRTCLASTAIALALGVPLALVLARGWPGVRLCRILIVLPMTMPPVVAGIALLATLGKRGMLGEQLSAMGLQISFTTAAVVVAQAYVSMPYLVVTLEAALRSRDTRPESIARTLGAGPWTVLARVTLPLVGPALARGTALAAGRSLGEFGATIAFAGSKQGVTRTVPLAIYLEREADPGTSLALAVVLIALSFLVVAATAVSWGSLLRHRSGRFRPSGRRAVADRGAVDDRGATEGRETEVSRGTTAGGGATGARASGATAPYGTGGETSRDAGLRTDGSGAGDTTGPVAPRGEPLHVSFTRPDRGVAVDLTVGAGRVLALVGPNGSGKSTVCEVVCGLGRASNGQVRLGGRLLDGPGAFVPAGRRGAALLAQEPGIFTHMSVLDNVAFGPRCQGVSRAAARKRALGELAAVGAERLAARSGSALSGGQAARVALARALAVRPRLLVLDEPLAALDVTARQELRALIARRAVEEDLTVLLVTHDVLDVTTLADDVVVLQDGEVAERGTVARVLAEPASTFAARLSGASVLAGVVVSSGGAEPALRLPSGRIVVGRPPASPEDFPAEGRPALALIPPDAVGLYRAAAPGPAGSPRNALPGTVRLLESVGALVTVTVELDGGQRLTATLTATAVAELGIEPGLQVMAVVKAVQVRIVPGGRAGETGLITGEAL